MNYQEVKALERAERLRSKFSNKSYSENWKNLRSFIAPVAFLIQLITATLAVALPAYLVKVISGSWLIGFIIGYPFTKYVTGKFFDYAVPVTPGDLSIIILITVTVSLLAAFIPAWRASKFDPSIILKEQ